MSEEWGPWVDHDGSGRPVPIGTVVRVRRSGGALDVIMVGRSFVEFEDPYDRRKHASTWRWEPDELAEFGHLIVAYRVRKPLGLTILEGILTGIREPEDA